jgi:hypothetical protein
VTNCVQKPKNDAKSETTYVYLTNIGGSVDSIQFHRYLELIEQTHSKSESDNQRKQEEITKLQEQLLQKEKECKELTESAAQAKEAFDAEQARAKPAKEELATEKKRHKEELEMEKNRPDGVQDVKQLNEQLAKVKQELEATKQRAEKAEINEFKQWKRAEAEKEARLAAEKNNSVPKAEVEQV